MSDFIHKLFTSYKERTDGNTRVGELYRIWYDSITNTLRIQLDNTPGGTVIGGGGEGGNYTLPVATSTVLGGVKIGSNISINAGVISVAAPFSGSYTDLTNKPTIPAAQIQSDWNQTTDTALDYIKNKPTVLTTEADTLDTVTDRGNTTTNDITVGDITTDKVIVNTSAGATVTTGQIAWNTADLTFDMGMANGVTLQVGQEQYIKVKAYEAISDGQAVMFAGASGEHILARKYDPTVNGFIPEWFIGIATQNLALNDFGYITVFGKVNALNTLAYTVGDLLYADNATPGALTNVAPSDPNPQIIVAAVTKRAGGDGHILVRPTFRSNIDTLTNVTTTSPASGEFLKYDGSKWINSSVDYTTLTNKPTLVTSYTQLTDKPNLAGTYSFSVAADDSTQRVISTNEVIKFVGAGGITTASDAEGNITITQSVAAAGTLTGSTLASGVTTSSLTSVGTLTGLTVNSSSSTAVSITADGRPGSDTNNWSFVSNQSIGGPRAWIQFPDTTLQTTAYTGNAATVTNGVYTTDTGTVTNTMLAGSIANDKLANSSITVNGTSISLGSSGTVTADASTLTGTELKSTVVTSSLTSVGTLTGLTSSGAVSITNNTNSSSTTTGALKVTGGVGIGGKLYVGDTVSAGAIDATNITASGTLKANNGILGTTQTTAYVFNDTATTVNIGGSASTISLGYSGTLTIGNSTVVGTQTSVNLWNTTSTTVNFAGAATTLNLGASTGTTTVNNNLSMASGKTIDTTGTITANNTTAFIAGDNAISNVALQIPREGAIRNLYNGLTNMYFDVSIGGTTQGQFQFRSSSAFTNILTMSPTAFNVNTDAVVTARTPSFGRLPFNSAIDTELTIDEYRFRINTTTGNTYAQIISNVTGQTKNSAWTAVAAISGQAVGQGGSTGFLVANNAWTSLYTFASMNSAGDTVTVTLQDKALGRIYRVTFMRSDNGSTTGYNIIAERLL